MSGLTVTAPAGADFSFDEVKTKRGLESLGTVPILVWNSADALLQYYGEEGVLAMADGTSLRVSYQSIARRMKLAGKSDDEIAKAQIDFRPGRRPQGQSTPASRAARAARTAVESGAVNADAMEKLMAKIASGELSNEDVNALIS